MIRLAGWVLKILAVVILFLALLGFAIKNTVPVVVSYYFGTHWQAPLVVVILVVFAVGAASGILAMSGHLLRQRRELTRLRRQAGPPAVEEAG
jgi:putative membrane protein